jgi:NADH-quinone oxidoreductase subunit M
LNQSLKDLTVREFATFLPLVVLAFWIGVFPKPFLTLIDKPVEKVVRIVTAGAAPKETVLAPRPAAGPGRPAPLEEGR